MKVITLMNEKGGVGKTTLAVHLAAGLAARGHKVVLIDADPQGSASDAIGFAPAGDLYGWLVRGMSSREAVQPVNPEVYAPDGTDGFLGVIRSNVETRNITDTVTTFTAFHDRAQELDAAFDFAVVDTSPTPSLLHATILMGTDYVILPTHLETMSIKGTRATVTHLREFFEQRQRLVGLGIGLMGVVPTMAQTHTIEHSENLKALEADFGEFVWEAIPRRIVWAEATTYSQPVWMLSHAGAAADDAWGLVDQFQAVLA